MKAFKFGYAVRQTSDHQFIPQDTSKALLPSPCILLVLVSGDLCLYHPVWTEKHYLGHQSNLSFIVPGFLSVTVHANCFISMSLSKFYPHATFLHSCFAARISTFYSTKRQYFVWIHPCTSHCCHTLLHFQELTLHSCCHSIPHRVLAELLPQGIVFQAKEHYLK